MKKYLSQGLGFLVLSSLLFGASPVSALTVGANSGSTFSDNSAVGTQVWSNTSNAQTSDNSYASFTSPGTASPETSHYLKVTGFGLNVPTGATIDGIEVTVERTATSTSVKDSGVYLVKNGTVTGSNLSLTSGTGFTSCLSPVTGNCWTTSEATVTYGGPTDLWGTTWTASDLNNASSGVVFSAVRSYGTGSKTISVDQIKMTVYYSKVTPTLSISNSPVTYNGSAQSANVSGSVDGVVSDVKYDGSSIAPTNAGTYAVTADFVPTDTGSYNSLNDVSAGNFVIQKADAVISVTPYSVTYDSNSHTATGTATGVNAEDLSESLNLTGTTHTNAGTYNNDDWTFSGGINYNDDSGTVDNEITKSDATCTVEGYNDVYDSASHGATGSCVGVNEEPLSGLNLGSSFTAVPGGTANWTFTDVTGNYNDDMGSVDINISTKSLKVLATGVSKIYDGNTDAEVVLGSEDVIEGDDVTFSYTSASFADAEVGADKDVSVSGVTLGGADALNYSLESDSAETTANISPVAANVTLDGDTEVVYDGASHELTASTDPEGLDTVVLYNGVPTAPVNVGTYTVKALIDDENYAGKTSSTLTISPREITVTADEDQGKIYGEEDPDLTYTVTGETQLVEGDELTGALSRDAGEDAGEYDILQGTLDNTNYDITFESDVFTIEKAEQVITFEKPSDKTLDDDGFSLIATSSSGLPVSFSGGVEGVCSVSEGTVHLIGLETCTVTASQEGNNNYKPATEVSQSFEVVNRVYMIHVSSGLNGAITPAGEEGSVGVAEGNSQTFTITPDKNYLVEDVIVDESSVGAVETYTFTEVSGNHSISATFKRRASTTSGSIPGGRVLGAFNDNSGDAGSTSGQVLGETKFIFTLDMKPGRPYNVAVFGNEVMELQKFLNNAGYGPLVVDGKFGVKTKAALIKFQLANGLVGDGVVGALTRAVLNK